MKYRIIKETDCYGNSKYYVEYSVIWLFGRTWKFLNRCDAFVYISEDELGENEHPSVAQAKHWLKRREELHEKYWRENEKTWKVVETL